MLLKGGNLGPELFRNGRRGVLVEFGQHNIEWGGARGTHPARRVQNCRYFARPSELSEFRPYADEGTIFGRPDHRCAYRKVHMNVNAIELLETWVGARARRQWFATDRCPCFRPKYQTPPHPELTLQ
jgi:hypothetical protein